MQADEALSRELSMGGGCGHFQRALQVCRGTLTLGDDDGIVVDARVRQDFPCMDPHDILAMADERFERRLTEESGAIRQEIAGVRQETAALRQEMTALRQEMTAVRQEMATRQEVTAVRQEMATRQEVTAIRQEMATKQEMAVLRQEMAVLRQDMTVGFAQVHERIANARTEVIKWSFLFWTGQFV